MRRYIIYNLRTGARLRTDWVPPVALPPGTYYAILNSINGITTDRALFFYRTEEAVTRAANGAPNEKYGYKWIPVKFVIEKAPFGGKGGKKK